VAKSCEHDSVKGGEFLDRLRNRWPLHEDSLKRKATWEDLHVDERITLTFSRKEIGREVVFRILVAQDLFR
jgi:hypothetical protein